MPELPWAEFCFLLMAKVQDKPCWLSTQARVLIPSTPPPRFPRRSGPDSFVSGRERLPPSPRSFLVCSRGQQEAWATSISVPSSGPLRQARITAAGLVPEKMHFPAGAELTSVWQIWIPATDKRGRCYNPFPRFIQPLVSSASKLAHQLLGCLWICPIRSQDIISQASVFSVASCSLHYIAVLYSILLLCSFPKLLSLSGLALPTPGSPSCHTSRTWLVPVAGRKPPALPRLVAVPWKALLCFTSDTASGDAASSSAHLDY